MARRSKSLGAGGTVSGKPLKLTSILDEGEDLVRGLGGRWLGLVCLALLPLRYAESRFWAHVLELGEDVSNYGEIMHRDGLWIALALPIGLYGRAVYVRAAHARWSGHGMTSRQALKVPPGSLLNYLAVTLILELLFLTLGWTLIALLPLAGLAGLAAATSVTSARPGIVAALRRIVEHGTYLRALIGIAGVMGLALLVAWVNLWVCMQGAVALLSGPLGGDVAAWRVLWSPSNPYFLLWAWAGARLVVEPFWLASHVVYANKVRSRSSGDDLRRRFLALETSPRSFRG